MIEVRFGYLQEQAVVDWRDGTICPLDNSASIIGQVQADANAYGGWFYPPLTQVLLASSESTKKPPLIPKGFSLPATHRLSFKNHGWTDDGANFVIALFGMLKGRRLQREGWQHFYMAPIDRKLGDFYATDQEIAHALDKACDFWLTHTDSKTRKLIFGALHWHLFAQLYQHEFERFNAQYMALDACCELAMKTWIGYPKARPQHATRPTVLCTQTGVPMPAWANIRTVGKKQTCDLAELRNALIHEAMYGDQPVGFSYPKNNPAMELELTGLVARIFLRLIGIDNEYTRSICTTRVPIGFGIIIQQEAVLVRRALEQIACTLEGLQSFPHAACGNASVLLGEWLIRKGIKGVEYVSGSSDELKTHAWLECDGLIIDITADQFGAGLPPVFVGRVRGVGVHGSTGSPRTGCSNFHDRFEIQSRHPCVMDGAHDLANYAALEMYLLQRV